MRNFIISCQDIIDIQYKNKYSINFESRIKVGARRRRIYRSGFRRYERDKNIGQYRKKAAEDGLAGEKKS